MNTSCESTSTLELREFSLATSAAIGRCWQSKAGQQESLLLDSAPCSHSLVLCWTKPRSLRDSRFRYAKERRSLLTNSNPFLEVVLALTGCL